MAQLFMLIFGIIFPTDVFASIASNHDLKNLCFIFRQKLYYRNGLNFQRKSILEESLKTNFDKEKNAKNLAMEKQDIFVILSA